MKRAAEVFFYSYVTGVKGRFRAGGGRAGKGKVDPRPFLGE